MLYAVWYLSYNFKKVKNTRGGVLLLPKVALLHGCFSRFSNCTTDTKSRNASHISWIIEDLLRIVSDGFTLRHVSANSCFFHLTLLWGPCHVETSLFISSENQWSGFYMADLCHERVNEWEGPGVGYILKNSIEKPFSILIALWFSDIWENFDVMWKPIL